MEAWFLWLAPHEFLSLFSYTVLAYLHSCGTSHSELDPPMPIINDPTELCIDNLMEAFCSMRFFFLDNYSLYQIEKPNNNNKHQQEQKIC